jgi:hypothetical protein
MCCAFPLDPLRCHTANQSVDGSAQPFDNHPLLHTDTHIKKNPLHISPAKPPIDTGLDAPDYENFRTNVLLGYPRTGVYFQRAVL